MPSTKLPAADKPLIRDPDLARALELELAPYTGRKLDAAQTAVRQVQASSMQGDFSTILGAYRSAILDAVGKARPDDSRS